MRHPAKQFYAFGPFRLDPVERLLYRDGEVVTLTAKIFDTLLVFVRNNSNQFFCGPPCLLILNRKKSDG